MPVKNEDWILEYSLSSASLWADHIIVADQNSTDATEELCARFEKVVYIKNTAISLNMSHARELLLDKARELWSDNLLFSLDADEVLSANSIHDADFLAKCESILPWESIELEWINLWGDIHSYRVDGHWWWIYKHFIFRDDGKRDFWDVPTSEPRMPEEYMKKSTRIESVKNLHYQFVDRERMLAKQRRYRVYDYLNSSKKNLWTAFKINLMYFPTKYVTRGQIKKLNDEWGYPSLTPKIIVWRKNYWYNDDILSQLSKYGAQLFLWLDIWDYDWSKGSPVFLDPRWPLQKIYHRAQPFLYCINRIVPQSLKNNL